MVTAWGIPTTLIKFQFCVAGPVYIIYTLKHSDAIIGMRYFDCRLVEICKSPRVNLNE